MLGCVGVGFGVEFLLLFIRVFYVFSIVVIMIMVSEFVIVVIKRMNFYLVSLVLDLFCVFCFLIFLVWILSR